MSPFLLQYISDDDGDGDDYEMMMMTIILMMMVMVMMMMKYILSSGSSWCHKQDWIAAEKVPAKEETCFLQQETVSPMFCRLQILSMLIKSFFVSY